MHLQAPFVACPAQAHIFTTGTFESCSDDWTHLAVITLGTLMSFRIWLFRGGLRELCWFLWFLWFLDALNPSFWEPLAFSAQVASTFLAVPSPPCSRLGTRGPTFVDIVAPPVLSRNKPRPRIAKATSRRKVGMTMNDNIVHVHVLKRTVKPPLPLSSLLLLNRSTASPETLALDTERFTLAARAISSKSIMVVHVQGIPRGHGWNCPCKAIYNSSVEFSCANSSGIFRRFLAALRARSDDDFGCLLVL